jgi:hypothetical protein
MTALRCVLPQVLATGAAKKSGHLLGLHCTSRWSNHIIATAARLAQWQQCTWLKASPAVDPSDQLPGACRLEHAPPSHAATQLSGKRDV